NAALIAAGTGLGEAILFRHGGPLVPPPTEGGDSDFSPTDAGMGAFLVWMRGQIRHVSVERAASGVGIGSAYAFLHDPDHGGSVPHEAPHADVGAAVSRMAASGECGGCSRALGLFLRVYGAEAGNLVLKANATAGLYVGGGIAFKNLGAMKDGRFLKAFHDKGRFREYMERIPVHVILEPWTPILGS